MKVNWAQKWLNREMKNKANYNIHLCLSKLNITKLTYLFYGFL